MQNQSQFDAPTAPGIFVPGRNCYRVAHAARAAFLVGADAYHDAFVQSALLAQRSIVVLAWNFNNQTRLTRRPKPDIPPTIGAFFDFLVKHRPHLHIYVLDWDYPTVHATDREFPPLFGLGWTPHRRVHFRYDNTHPVAGSHHQKVVVIDDAVAFSGGLDFTCRRAHGSGNPGNDAKRDTDEPSTASHDVMAMVDGEAAQALGAIARERWQVATGETLPAATTAGDSWPAQVTPDAIDLVVGISRTGPAPGQQTAVREIEQLYLDMIAQARRYIYIENQYLTANKLGEALAARLAQPSPPEVVVVVRLLSHGWLEENTMSTLRAQLIGQLHASDRSMRLGIYYPHVRDLKEGTCVDVHSQVMIVDDEWLRIGSANFCNRSMGLDSECDLTFEAQGAQRVASVVRGFRDRLLAGHLGVSPQQFANEVGITGSLNGAITALQDDARTLRRFKLPDSPVTQVPASRADPEQPVPLDALIQEFSPDMKKHSGPSWGTFVIAALVFAGLTAVWRFTPLGELVTAEKVVEWARDFGGRPWAPIVVLLAFTPACFIMFPRPLITLFSVVAFGPGLGFVYAMAGILIAAIVTYYAGRLLKRSTVRRLAGTKLNQVTEVLRKRGLIACTALRLVPLAPFAVEGLVAGAIRIKLWHFALGTAIGILPGTLATTVFGDQLEAALRDPSEINYWLVGGAALLLVIAILVVRQWFSTQIRKQGPALTSA